MQAYLKLVSPFMPKSQKRLWTEKLWGFIYSNPHRENREESLLAVCCLQKPQVHYQNKTHVVSLLSTAGPAVAWWLWYKVLHHRKSCTLYIKRRKNTIGCKNFECCLFYAYGIRRKGMQMLCRQLFILMHVESFSVVID